MNKLEKRKLLQEYQVQQMEEFEENLPMEKKLFYECNHDFSLTNEFLKDKNADIEMVIEFLRENGAGCDCEVIFNVEEKFEE